MLPRAIGQTAFFAVGESPGFRIDLLPGARITDYLVESKDFIAVTNAEVWDQDRKVLSAPFINVALQHIQIVMPG